MIRIRLKRIWQPRRYPLTEAAYLRVNLITTHRLQLKHTAGAALLKHSSNQIARLGLRLSIRRYNGYVCIVSHPELKQGMTIQE
jgi:hypothetical protein